jgi:hypothetical protein
MSKKTKINLQSEIFSTFYCPKKYKKLFYEAVKSHIFDVAKSISKKIKIDGVTLIDGEHINIWTTTENHIKVLPMTKNNKKGAI